MSEGIRKGVWTCSSCRKLNDGPVRSCIGRGSPRSDAEGEEIVLPEDAPEVSNAAEIAEAKKGPDRCCSNCGRDNAAGATTCVSCGAGMGSDDPILGEGKRHRAAMSPPVPAPLPEPPSRGPWKIIGIVASVMLVVGTLIWYLFFHTSSHPATIVETHWVNTVEIEKLVTEYETGWEVPSGGRVSKSYQKIRTYRTIVVDRVERTRQVSQKVQVGTERVKVGTKNLKNGYFQDIYENRPKYENRLVTEKYMEDVTAQIPVFDTYYEYTIDRWRHSRPVEAAGSWDPRWPTFTLADKEREGRRTQKFVVKLDDRGTTREFEPNTEEKFRTLKVGTPCIAEVTPSGSVRDVHVE